MRVVGAYPDLYRQSVREPERFWAGRRASSTGCDRRAEEEIDMTSVLLAVDAGACGSLLFFGVMGAPFAAGLWMYRRCEARRRRQEGEAARR